jgi:nitrogen fixation/metabolism regulation signal transduction histidine kinase
VPGERRIQTDRLILFGILALVVVLTAVYALLQKTDQFSWQYVTNTILFSFLGIVNVILILSLIVMLVRSLIKLLLERYREILGSRFRTKLVFTFLGLCLVPSVLLFAAAVSIIDRSIERWFSTDVERISEGALGVVDAYYQEHRRRGERFASDIAGQLSQRALVEGPRRPLLQAMEDALRLRHLDLVSLYLSGQEPLTVANPRIPINDLKPLPDTVLKAAFRWLTSKRDASEAVPNWYCRSGQCRRRRRHRPYGPFPSATNASAVEPFNRRPARCSRQRCRPRSSTAVRHGSLRTPTAAATTARRTTWMLFAPSARPSRTIN